MGGFNTHRFVVREFGGTAFKCLQTRATIWIHPTSWSQGNHTNLLRLINPGSRRFRLTLVARLFSEADKTKQNFKTN